MDVMKVSPVVFSEIQEKVAESWANSQIYPGTDLFADWANKTFGCVLHRSYRVVVVWEWGTAQSSSQFGVREYSWRATILWQMDQMDRMPIEHPLPWMRVKPCTALVKEGPKAMVVYENR